MKKQKIVHIEDFFHPDAGYQVNILAKYLSADNYKVYVLAAEFDKMPSYLTDFFGREDIKRRDEQYSEKYDVTITRIPLKTYISGRAIYSTQLWEEIRKINPDILYVHGCDTYVGMQVIRKTGKMKCKVITDNHMVDLASQNPLRSLFRIYYRKMVTPYIIKHKIPVLRMADIDYVEKRLGIPLEFSPFIPFGADTMLFHPDLEEKRNFREIHGFPADTRIFCYAGKLDEYKGGKFLAEVLLQKMPVERNIVFLIIGNTSGTYGEEVENLFAKSKNTILRLPTQKYEELSKYYQSADAAVYPLGCSLSFFDVQACGLPVISEAMDINVERCSHGNGFNFSRGNIEECRKQICKMANLPDEELRKMSQNAAKLIIDNYNYADIYKKYISILRNL